MTAILADTELTTTASNTLATVGYVHVETRIERYERMSNEAAERAAWFFERGFTTTGEVEARTADDFAHLAVVVHLLELAFERLP